MSTCCTHKTTSTEGRGIASEKTTTTSLTDYARQKKQDARDSEYTDIINSTDVNEVRRYLNSLSTSNPRYNDVSNHLAILLAIRLNEYSLDYDYNHAKRYAMSEVTKEIVKKYVKEAKAARKKRKRSWY